jgi:hypothetical protein
MIRLSALLPDESLRIDTLMPGILSSFGMSLYVVSVPQRGSKLLSLGSFGQAQRFFIVFDVQILIRFISPWMLIEK